MTRFSWAQTGSVYIQKRKAHCLSGPYSLSRGQAGNAAGRPLLRLEPWREAWEGLRDPLSYACSRFTKTSTAFASYPSSTLLFSSNTSSVFQWGQNNLDQHLQIQGSHSGQGSGRKVLRSPTEPPSLLLGHHPDTTPVPGNLLTTCFLWGAVPTPQNIELSISTNSKALA